MITYAIFDLDGCISDDRWRMPDWYNGALEAYHTASSADKPVNLPRVKREIENGHSLLFVTGRPEKYRAKTVAWLQSHLDIAISPEALLMRPVGDHNSSPELKVRLLNEAGIPPKAVAVAYDDRVDILDAYRKWGIADCRQLVVDDEEELGIWTEEQPKPDVSADQILVRMASTFRERNAGYKDNFKAVGRVMEVLHGNDSPSPAKELVGTAAQFNKWHLYELMIVKLTRFANSGLNHKDSIHDIAVYAAMIEALIQQGEE